MSPAKKWALVLMFNLWVWYAGYLIVRYLFF